MRREGEWELRGLLSWGLAGCLWVGAVLVAGEAFADDAARQPNVVVVFIDDLGWGDFSCFGNKEGSTPHIDRMAAEGIRFSQFYVSSPICSPSRCSLTTGQYPQRWKITSFLNSRADNARRGVANWLDPEAPTLARILQQHGYRTGHFGKWHLGGQRDVDDAPAIAKYGFDASLTNFEGMGAKLLPLTLKPGDSVPGKIWSDAERLGAPVTWMQRSKITGGFVDGAIAFIDAATRDGKPFYVNVWPDDVHSPFWPPVETWGENKRELYLAVLEAMDLQLGKLFEHLRSRDELRENTIMLICSDNGPEAGAGSAGPFRGGKTELFEGGIRSPLIVWSPSLVAAEQRGKANETAVLSTLDLLPSLAKLAGAPLPADVQFDGEESSATLLGRGNESRTAPLFWRRPPDRKTAGAKGRRVLPDLAMREGKWKLLCDYDGAGALLYDLESDRGETKNLAEQHPDRTKAMQAKLLAWHSSMPADRGPELGQETLESLRKTAK